MTLIKRIPPTVIRNNKLRRGRKLRIPPSGLDEDLADYFARVEAVSSFGDGNYTETEIKGHFETLVADLKACGAWDECAEIHVFCGPTTLVGAVEKLKVHPNAIRTNSAVFNITDSVYTSSGPLGGIRPGANSNTKFLFPGYGPSLGGTPGGNCHIACYINGLGVGSRSTQCAVGSRQTFSSSTRFGLHFERYMTTTFGAYCYDTTSNTYFNPNNAQDGNTFCLFNTSQSLNRDEYYRDGPRLTWALGSYSTSRGNNPTRYLGIFAEYDGNSTPGWNGVENGMVSRLSFVSYGAEISDESGFYNAWNKFRLALGLN